MKILFDGLPITGQSLAIVSEHLLEGWLEHAPEDELHLAVGPNAELTVPDGVIVHQVPFGRSQTISRIHRQNTVLPRLAREIGADALLATLPTTAIVKMPCPKFLIAYDLRHELRPEQFSRMNRIQRRFSYRWEQAAAIGCISDRTRKDLLASRPHLADRPVVLAYLGGDHVDGWPRPHVPGDYALAFGQYGNKNVDLVIDAWGELEKRGNTRPLRIVGLGGSVRPQVEQKIADLGLTDRVTAMHWLPDDEFRKVFAGAGMVVFPSDFEGFGMPAVEAMRMDIPVVITPEPALVEVTAGHAEVMDGWDAPALADAVQRCEAWGPERVVEARAHAADFTWAHTASVMRELMVAELAGAPR
ncbi:glycosyltransferase family 4 protein [Nocardioides caeni]|uniref:Glycosyltransferase family 4 protein n=1 Tax=Nocardioides caeni TaxID=574700 RepID=A0A4S8N133_9ACTN|nr:glycosyltransferase family 1 protein [Nocardioides caeni]THV09212.1 glycosyltransferase family 4 protein [Nocardioides caeni]